MPWIAGQTKVRCKLGIQRLRTTIDKNESLAKRSRREVANLLEAGKIETARIRTESLILSDGHNELLELLELYLELLLARWGLVELNAKEREPDEGIREAVCAIVYAAPRCEVRELHYVREAFMSKYGRDWAIRTMDGEGVSARVHGKTKSETPSLELVDLYLTEISKAYGCSWRPVGYSEGGKEDEAHDAQVKADEEQALRDLDGSAATSSTSDNDDEDGGSGGGGMKLALPAAPSEKPVLSASNIAHSTTHIPIISPSANEKAPPKPSTPAKGGNTKQDPDLGLPSTPPFDPKASARTVVITSMGKPPTTLGGKKVDDRPDAEEDGEGQIMASRPKPVPKSTEKSSEESAYDDLARRFEALKRK